MDDYKLIINTSTNTNRFIIRLKKIFKWTSFFMILFSIYTNNIILIIVNGLILIFINILLRQNKHNIKNLIINQNFISLYYNNDKFTSETIFWQDLLYINYSYKFIIITSKLKTIKINQVDFPNDFYLIKNTIKDIKKIKSY